MPEQLLTPAPEAAAETDNSDAADDAVEDELLIEEISIDGMCGVY
jgi:mycofactocin precursor